MSTLNQKPSILHVKTFEEEVYLIQEGEKNYSENWGMDAKEAYLKWLEFINNLKL